MNARALITALFMTAVILFSGGALAEPAEGDVTPDISGWQSLADEAGVGIDLGDIYATLSAEGGALDWNSLIDEMAGQVARRAANMIPDLLMLMGPALIWAVNRQMHGSGDSSLAGAVDYVCYIVEAGALLKIFSSQLSGAYSIIDMIARLTEQVAPVMVTLIVAVGGTSTAAALSPASVFAGTIITSVVRAAASALSSAAAVLAIAGNISERVKLSGMFKLIKSAGNWIMGAALTVFIGVMTVSGTLSSAKDGVSIRTAKYAVDNLFPVVGGEVADTLDTMVASAALIKNAAGVTGLILLAALCLSPVIELAMVTFMCRLGAALMEPLSCGPIGDLIDRFADVMRMLLVAVGTCCVIFVVLVGVMISSGNAIVMLR